MTCSAIHEKVAYKGAVVSMYPSTRPGLALFNRYVSNSLSCLGQGALGKASVPTIDDPRCPVTTCYLVTGKGPAKKY
ncbi:hypothetical protein CPY51_29945 [Rhizobium tubonense]|uniref:Uncharacterized protein n=1 Tax=Rhizobium tubonense TaxID=484088 RepID=A0A2W4C3A4_9HYPH|nr:hypothetical protein CPY51_29945 [Rhizobium tubonense]